jgi:predicted O-methyltransferase YrrM
MTMHMSDILREQIARFRAAVGMKGGDALDILETGTIRQDTEAHRLGDGWSTLTFAEVAAEVGGYVTSIDLDVSVARKVITRYGHDLHVVLREGHSIEWMASMIEAGQKFDVILLDSDNDAQLILHEYLLARKLLRHPGLLLVDDVAPGSATVVKGQQLVPWLDGRGVKYMITPRTGGGVHSGVLSAIL